MGETRVRLDPAGYKRAVEEEIPLSYTGEELYDIFRRAVGLGPGAIFPGDFFAPQGSGRLCCKPRQFNPLWYADGRLENHVLHKDLWTWATGLNVHDYQPPHKVGAPLGFTYPDDRWFSFWVPPGTPTLFTVDWVVAGLACNLTLPADMVVAGFCPYTPASVGIPLTGDDAADFTPYLQFVHYPAPDNCVAFGWSQFLVLLFGDNGYLLRSPNNDKAGWELLGHWTGGDYRSMIEIPAFLTGQPEAVQAMVRSLLVMEVGDSDFYLYRTQGLPVVIPYRKSPPLGEMPHPLPAGAWWVAAPAGQKVLGQVQVVGYEIAMPTGFSSGTAGAANRPTTFDLGQAFAPTQEPDYRPVITMHMGTGGFTTTSVPAGTQITAPVSGEQLVFDLQNQEDGAHWVSNGAIHKGFFHLELRPSTAPGKPGGYLAPSVKLVTIVFPALLVARHNRELILNDTEFDSWDIEASYYRPEDSTISVYLREEQALLLEDAGHARRANYPLLIEEAVIVLGEDDEPEVLWVTRAAGWVQAAELEETKVENTVAGDDGLKLWRLKARGMLSRAERRWLRVPEITDPAGQGYVEHTFAVKKALAMSHFDVTATDAVEIAADPNAGTARARLPATWALQLPKPGKKVKNAHGPTWSETKLAYAHRIAWEWADWTLYTLLNGKVWYHPNLPVWLAEQEENFWYSVTLYKSAAAAVAAGHDGRQTFWETDSHFVEPRANVWAVIGLDDELEPVLCVEKASETIDDIDDPNFVGEEIPYTVKTRLAVREDACKILTRIGVRRSKRRLHLRRFGTRLAPWDIEGDPNGLDVGIGFQAQDRGKFIAVHVRCRLVHRDVYETVITGEEVPAGTLEGVEPGAYPGQGLPDPEEG